MLIIGEKRVKLIPYVNPGDNLLLLKTHSRWSRPTWLTRSFLTKKQVSKILIGEMAKGTQLTAQRIHTLFQLFS